MSKIIPVEFPDDFEVPEGYALVYKKPKIGDLYLHIGDKWAESSTETLAHPYLVAVLPYTYPWPEWVKSGTKLIHSRFGWLLESIETPTGNDLFGSFHLKLFQNFADLPTPPDGLPRGTTFIKGGNE